MHTGKVMKPPLRCTTETPPVRAHVMLQSKLFQFFCVWKGSLCHSSIKCSAGKKNKWQPWRAGQCRTTKVPLATSRICRPLLLLLLPSVLFKAAATKVVCFVFVKLCILWRLYCCKKCWEKKKKIKVLKFQEWPHLHTTRLRESTLSVHPTSQLVAYRIVWLKPFPFYLYLCYEMMDSFGPSWTSRHLRYVT